MKVKVKYQAKKNSRIKRFYRECIEILGDKDNWYSVYTKFQKGDKTIFVKRTWEQERLSLGLPCYSVSEYEEDGFSSTITIDNIKSVKSAVRKIRQYGKYFENGTEFKDLAGWIGYGVNFKLINPNYNEEELKKELYSDIKIAREYSDLSDNEQLNNVVIALRDAGFFVSVKFENGTPHRGNYWSMEVSGKNIVAAYCTENTVSHYALSGAFLADHVEKFNKWSQCDYQSSLPTNKKEINKLVDDMLKLSGYENAFGE